MLDLDLAEQRLTEGLGRNAEGHSAAAARMLRDLVRTVETAADRRPAAELVLARAYVGLATSTFDTDADLTAAQTLLRRAADHAEAAGADAVRAAIRGQQALLLMRSGRLADAADAFGRAMELIDVALPRDQVRILVNRGTLALEFGRLDQARVDLRAGVRIAAAEGDVLVESMARHNLGYTDFLAGNLPRALAEMSAAADIAPGGRTPVFYLDRARVLREAGLVRDADVALASAAEEFRADRRGQELAEVELLRAECALVEGAPDRGRTLALGAARRFRRRGNVMWQRRSEFVALRCERALAAESPARLSRLATRITDFVETVAAEGRRDLADAGGLLLAGTLLAAGEDPVRAGAEGAEGAEGAAKTASLDAVLRLRPDDTFRTRIERREVRAQLALARHDPARARREVRVGLAELTDHRARFDSLDLRTAAAVHGSRLAGLGTALALADGGAARLFDSLEWARSVLVRVPGVSGPADPEGAELLGALRRAEEESRDLIGEPEHAAERARLRERVADLQRQIRSRAWERDGAAPVDTEVVTLGRVREVLRTDPGATLVNFGAYGGRWYAVEVTAGRARVRELGSTTQVAELMRRVRADLDALALPLLPEPIASTVRTALADELAQLDEILLAGSGAGGPLVLATGGNLAAVPWTLLPSRRGLPTVVAPSATMWWRAWRAGVRPDRPSVLAVAGPGLDRAEDEAARVGAAWPGAEVLGGVGATAARVRTALADHDVIHVAAHGVHQSQSPLFSSLRLADGPLFAHELEDQNLRGGCVLISACEAGLVSVRPGDQPLGLASVLLQLGTRAVVAGVANVNDRAAADVMTDVHTRLAAGTDSATALAAALADHDGPPAPFVCYGSAW
ncbi:CHAT domain-containing protein [Occultella glacieicola]|uniref:CHAT domain-containing protein n=1 Tax=Occultella glacieicola TaxID=2518684 RepID=A0ABY2E9B4_9MICO|nr:CHAT domain-containing protein [Occultella glacieicola]TDE99093.1 CHAT domain-containing protein [Occultella glacieicola]